MSSEPEGANTPSPSPSPATQRSTRCTSRLGNPGIAAVATLHDVDPMSGEAVAALARDLGADLVVVGPEAPLVAGVADAVTAAGIACFGPTKAAAQLEGSKAFAKDVMQAAGVPTAAARLCTTPDEVAAALDELGSPYVVKDDGLAAGKGVIVTTDRAAAVAHAASCERVVVEEYLDGPEVSLFGLCDGATVVPLQPAQDYKRIFDGDEGPEHRRAWAPTRRCPGRRPTWSRRCSATFSSRPSMRWRGAARRSEGSCTPASR